jgi:predicted nucleic-acid-binding protein
MIFVDTNYFIRLLVEDDKRQLKIAKELFLKGARQKVELATSSVVIFETYWVLKSIYKLSRVKLVEGLRVILGMSFIKLPERDILMVAIELYEEAKVELVDCYNLVLARELGCDELASFDLKLKKLVRKDKSVREATSLEEVKRMI